MKWFGSCRKVKDPVVIVEPVIPPKPQDVVYYEYVLTCLNHVPAFTIIYGKHIKAIRANHYELCQTCGNELKLAVVKNTYTHYWGIDKKSRFHLQPNWCLDYNPIIAEFIKWVVPDKENPIIISLNSSI